MVIPAQVTPNVQVAQKMSSRHVMILDDWRTKVRDVAEAVGISTARVHNMLDEYLEMKKVSV